MKLVLYSGGNPEENIDLDAQLIRMLGATNPRTTLIPSSFEHTEEDYEDFRSHFEPMGLVVDRVLNVDRIQNSSEIDESLAADFIYLSGGNTFYFLESLRKAKLMKQLKSYANGAGVLAGRSAGAILMTPNIATAGIPDFDRDENPKGIKNLKAMDLVPFEFFPHYPNRKPYDLAFQEHTAGSGRALYACKDGAGIVVNDKKLSFVGEVYGFVNGVKFRLK